MIVAPSEQNEWSDCIRVYSWLCVRICDYLNNYVAEIDVFIILLRWQISLNKKSKFFFYKFPTDDKSWFCVTIDDKNRILYYCQVPQYWQESISMFTPRVSLINHVICWFSFIFIGLWVASCVWNEKRSNSEFFSSTSTESFV